MEINEQLFARIQDSRDEAEFLKMVSQREAILQTSPDVECTTCEGTGIVDTDTRKGWKDCRRCFGMGRIEPRR